MKKLVFFIFFILIIFGLVMIASAGIADGQRKFDDPYYYVKHQFLYGVLPGLAIFWIFSKIKHTRWKTFSFPLLLLALGLMFLVFSSKFGVSVKGAQRWIDLGFVTVQPSEFLKFALIAYLAAWFSGKKSAKSLVPFILILACIAMLLILQPNLGTLGMVFLISAGMYFFSGAKLKHFTAMILIIAALMGIFAVAAPYRFNRIKAFLNPASDTRGTSYHINQALISIGSGGIFGLGYGQSRQKSNYLPEPVGDSIFAIAVEELGFFGGAVIIGLFAALIIGLAGIAQNAPGEFGRLFTLGVAVWIGAQTFINIGAISGIIPLTGIPLPLVSYGSSSLVSLMMAMGIIRSISRA